jgi:hypothetical protein
MVAAASGIFPGTEKPKEAPAETADYMGEFGNVIAACKCSKNFPGKIEDHHENEGERYLSGPDVGE